MAFRSLSGTGIQPNDSFIPQLQKTSYRAVLDQRLVYQVFVHKATFSDHFHHQIVLCDENQKYGFVTLELGKNAANLTVVPRCEQYQGEERDLELKGTVETTMRELADIAIDILRDMGDFHSWQQLPKFL